MARTGRISILQDHRRHNLKTLAAKPFVLSLPQSQHPSSDPNNDDSDNLLNSKSLVCAGAFGGTARSVATTTSRACAGAPAGGRTGAPATDTDSDCTPAGTRTSGPTTTTATTAQCSAYTGTAARTTTTTTRRVILNKDIKRGPDVDADLIAVGFRQLGRLLEIGTSTFLVDCLDESGAEGVGVLAEAGVLVDKGEGEAAGGEISIQEGLDADGIGGELGC